MLKRLSAIILATCLALSGQSSSNGSGVETTIFPPPQQAFAELKEYLTLTDSQVTQLRKLLEDRSAVLQEHYRKIREKQTELDNLLKNGSRDLARIGQLTLDIHTLSTQPPSTGDQSRQQALAILTAEQRTKLGSLDQALKLATPGYQAVTLNLIDPPPPGRPIILTTPGAAEGTPVPLPTPISASRVSR